MRIFIAILALFVWAPAWSQTQLSSEDEKALIELEEEVSRLKESTFQAKTRLHELEEAVLRGKISGSKAMVVFENQAEGIFVLDSAEFFLDDQLIKKVQVDPKAPVIKTLTAFDGNLPAGDHKLVTRLNYRGSNKSMYKTFSYFKDHIFRIETVENFPVEYGKTTQVRLTSLDKGYFKSSFDERLFLRVEILRDWGTEVPEANK